MELRNGVWTSRAKADDARKIKRLAKRIIEASTDPAITEDARKILSLARDLERDL
jgi:hypothetical protein